MSPAASVPASAFEYQEGKGGAIVAGFCREHTELWEKVK
jgi:hypothetical protein